MTIKKLPAPFRFCEGCRHFEALAYGDVLKCKKLGLVFDGMVVCVYRKGGRNGIRNGHGSDNDPGNTDSDSVRRRQ